MKKVMILCLGLALGSQGFTLAQAEIPPVPATLGLQTSGPGILESLDLSLVQESVPGASFQARGVIKNPTEGTLTLVFAAPPKTLYKTTEDKAVEGPYTLVLKPQETRTLQVSYFWTQGDRPRIEPQGGQAPLGAHLWNHYQRGPQAHRYLFQFSDLKHFAKVEKVRLTIQKMPGGWVLGSPDVQERAGPPAQDWDFILGLPGDYSLLGFTAAPGYGFKMESQTSQALFLGTLDLALGPLSLSAGIEGRSQDPLRGIGLLRFMAPWEPRPINPLDADWDLRFGAGVWQEVGPEGRKGLRGLIGGRWRSLPLEFSWDWSWDSLGQNPQQGFQVYLAWGF